MPLSWETHVLSLFNLWDLSQNVSQNRNSKYSKTSAVNFLTIYANFSIPSMKDYCPQEKSLVWVKNLRMIKFSSVISLPILPYHSWNVSVKKDLYLTFYLSLRLWYPLFQKLSVNRSYRYIFCSMWFTRECICWILSKSYLTRWWL